MSESPISEAFELTRRQRRLRTLTAILLVVIVAMLAFAAFHPFFHPTPPPVLTEKVRKALAAQGIMILGYIAVVFGLALALVIIAWLYVREIRLQLLMAQRNIWKEIVDKHADSQASRAGNRNGAQE
jgi:H+/gluconate symporter-like permease